MVGFAFWWETTGKEPLEIPRRRWKDNTKMDIQEIGWETSTGLTCLKIRDKWRAHVNTLMNLRIAQNEGNCLTGSGTVSFSKGLLRSHTDCVR